MREAKSTFLTMDRLWMFKLNGKATKVKILNFNVTTVLFYAHESVSSPGRLHKERYAGSKS